MRLRKFFIDKFLLGKKGLVRIKIKSGALRTELQGYYRVGRKYRFDNTGELINSIIQLEECIKCIIKDAKIPKKELNKERKKNKFNTTISEM